MSLKKISKEQPIDFEFNRKNLETKDLSKGYFDGLSEEIENLPKPKYYDETMNNLRRDVKRNISKLNNQYEDTTLDVTELYKLVEELKEKQQELIETNVPLGEDPPEVSNSDPLTPIDQNFVTLEQLQRHYKLFVERVQYQLGSIGGGGAGFIKDLDDVTFDGTNNELLIYNSSTSKWVGIASTALSSSSEIAGISTTGTSVFKNLQISGVSTYTDTTNSTSVSTGSLVINGGVGVALSMHVGGSLSVGGTITYEDVTNIDSVGIVTAGGGLQLGRGPSVASIESAASTKTSTSEAAADTFTASTYRSAQYQIQVTRGSQYHVTTMNVLHDGTNVFMSEFGTIKTGVTLATFDADINSGNVRLLVTPTSSDSTVFKIVKSLTLT